MFEQAVLSSGPAAKRVWTTSIGLVGQAVAVGSLVLLSVVWPQALPIATILTKLEAPGPPPAPQPPGPQVRPRGPVTHPFMQIHNGGLVAPTPDRVPAQAQIIDDPPLAPGGPTGDYFSAVPGGLGPGVPGGILTQILRPPTPRPVETTRPAQPKPEVVAAPRIIRISDLRMARPIHRVEPLYPQLAKQAGVQGVVEIEAIIATDGHLRDLRVVSGHPLLIKAAVDAVRQWIYEPTVLNGEKVEVIAPITVNFRLNR
jgi:periplasmic protein TonB